MLTETLDLKHPSYDADLWRRYDAIYRGGAAFRALIGEFLPQNQAEEADRYERRKVQAPYRSYVGPIVDFFAAKLFSAPIVIRAKSRETDAVIEPDAFYSTFKEDCDRLGTDLDDFARSRISQAFVKGRAWHLVEMPDDGDEPPLNRADYDARKLGNARVHDLENEQVLDWDVDEDGHLLWVIVHTVEKRRRDPRAGRAGVVERWAIYDRQNVETFEAVWQVKKNQYGQVSGTEERPEVAQSLGVKPHGFARVPLVRLGFVGTRGVRTKVRGSVLALSPSAVEGLWLTNRLADSQVEHFRLSAAMSWNLKLTCYAMAVFKLEDGAEGERRMPTMGTGYGTCIGVSESFEWAAPPTQHLAIMREQIDAERTELYRVANQMAQGIDNNAAAIGRSGESKAVDAAAAEVCLRVYGAIVKEAIEQTYDLIAEARGEHDICWSVEGLDTFNLGDLDTVVEGATKAKLLDIQSPTFWREVSCRIVDMLVPHVDQQTKQTIRAEIEASIAAQAEAQAAAAKSHAVPDEEDDDTDEDEAKSDDEDESDEDDAKAV
jgi:hypothetical protein